MFGRAEDHTGFSSKKEGLIFGREIIEQTDGYKRALAIRAKMWSLLQSCQSCLAECTI